MKKVIISFIFVFVNVFLFGQSPTVTIQCNGGTCFFTDPNPTLASYNASINDGVNSTTNGWTRQILWVPTGGTVFSPIGQGTPTCSVNWNNTSNTPTKKMKVTVTYTKT